MSDNFADLCIKQLLTRALPDGGFALTDEGEYRPDATAWAILALDSINANKETVNHARSRLKRNQDEDGRVTIKKGFSAPYWPTALAALAWHSSPLYQKEYQSSVNFLLSASGICFPKEPHIGHDTTLKGWAWIEGTHSWIEPTVMAILALSKADLEQHERIIEARKLILNRQLPKGGWNYGNITVYGQELHPVPHYTGMCLYALAGIVDRQRITKSIDYLRTRIQKDRTPLSLGWSILGLFSWGEESLSYDNWITESWYLQEKYGTYNTSFLSIILMAYAMAKDNKSIF